MSEQPRAPVPWSVPALMISAIGSVLLGLSAGAKMDELVRPTLGDSGAGVVGLLTVASVAVLVGALVYRGMTRKG